MGYQHWFDRRRQRARNVPCNSGRNKVRAIMSLADQEADSISAELSSYQGIFVSSYSTNFNVHYTLAMNSKALLNDSRMPVNFSMLSAVIFDLDGVLADSEPWWNEIDAKLLAEYGVTYRGEHHQKVVGVSYRLAVEFYKKAFGLSVPTEEMMRRRGEIATEFFANRVGLFPHGQERVEKLR